MPPRIYYLDHLRLFLILIIALHHSSGGYALNPTYSVWFFHEALMYKHEIFDVIYLFLDTFMLSVIFFIAGLFSVFSLKKRGVFGFLRERFLRLIVPLIVLVPTMLPLLQYPKFMQIKELKPQLKSIASIDSYFSYAFSSFFWKELVVSGTYWFLVFLFLITLLFILFRYSNVYIVLQQWVKRSFETESLKCLILLVSINSLFMWVGDFFIGFRKWIGFRPYLSFIGSQFIFNSFMFCMGMLWAENGFLDKPTWIQKIVSRHTFFSTVTILCMTCYLFYFFGMSYETITDQRFIDFYKGGGAFFEGLVLAPEHFIITFPRCFLFVCIATFGTFAFLGTFYKKFNKPLKNMFSSLPECTMGIFLFHLPLIIWAQYFLVDVAIPSFIKMLFGFVVGVGLSWRITILLRRVAIVRRIL